MSDAESVCFEAGLQYDSISMNSILWWVHSGTVDNVQRWVFRNGDIDGSFTDGLSEPASLKHAHVTHIQIDLLLLTHADV